MSLLPNQPLLPSTNSSSGLGRYKTASELLADRRADRGGFKRAILQEKLDAFQGGISSGGIRAQATNALKRIIQIKGAIRRTVPKAPPRAPVVAPVSVPIERIATVPRPDLDILTGGQGLGPSTIVDGVWRARPDPIDAAIKRQMEKPVSLWSNLGKAVTKGITTGVQARVASKIAPGVAVGVAGRVLPSLGRVLGSRSAGAAAAGVAVGQMLGNGAGEGGGCAVGFHPNKQDGVRGPAGTYCVRNRRMNFGNARAARRGVRRLKGARKLLRDIERLMPTKTSRRRAPAHHHHPAAGG